jgi:seryl-tRNA synthetase
MSQEFQREDRYIVIKRKDLDTAFRSDVRQQFYTALHRLNCHDVLIPQRKFLVIESDWPEYEIVWQMIEARMTGRNLQSQQYVLRAMALNYRNGHSWDHLDGEAVTKAADEITRLQAEIAALQQRLNVADQQVDELQTQLSEIVSAVRSINHGEAHEVRVPGDDEPQYRQRKEWVDWILQLCEQAIPQ